MKGKSILLIFTLLIALLTGCAQQNAQNGTTTTTPTTTAQATTTPATTTSPDAVSSASIVNDATAFEKAISSSGTWIICLTKDLTIDKDITLDGEFKNGKKDDAGKDIIQRKVALYSQDENRNITARYTLTAPKFTVKSPEGSIQHGTFKGDLYVSVKNFKLVDTTVEGNVYFTTEEAKSTFSADSTSKITGKQEMAQ
jgi:pectate lyase